MKYRYFVDGKELADVHAAASCVGTTVKKLHEALGLGRTHMNVKAVARVPARAALDEEDAPQSSRQSALAYIERKDRMRHGGGLLARVEVCR